MKTIVGETMIFIRAVAVVLGVMAIIVLIGWQLNIPELKSLLSKDRVPMVANSAICFLYAGTIHFLFTLTPSPLKSRGIQMLALLILATGLLTFIEYLFDVNLGIDQLIFAQPSEISNHPGRMSIVTALNFSLVGLCFWLDVGNWDKKFMGQYAMLLAFFTTLYPFTGTIFGALHFGSKNTSMAVPTAICFFLIIASYFVRHARHGFAALLFSNHIAGVLIRRILMPVAFIYPLAAFFSLQGEKAGLYNIEGETVFMMVSSMALFTIIVLITAQTISRLDIEKDQYKKFFELSSEVLMIASPDGSIKLVSNAFTKVLGYSNKEGVNNSFFYFVHPEDTAAAVNQFKRLSTDTTPGSFQIQMKGKDGNVRHFLWSYSVDEKSRDIFTAGYDITEIKEAQQVRELAQRLSIQNEKLDSFTHIVSHNLRSHVGNLNSLLQLHRDAKPEEQSVLFGMFEKVAHHLDSTLNNLIESLRIKQDITKERNPIYFDQVLIKTKEILASQLLESHAAITHHFPVESIAYPGVYLESIFLNLLSNAIKYRSAVRPLQVMVETAIMDHEIILTVKDNGLGINMAQHGDKLFGFYKTFHDGKDSRGIGLFITKAQVEAMGGTISAESEVDHGTTFKVVFNKKL